MAIKAPGYHGLVGFEQNEIVGYPVIGRFGLGHSLLAWARCFIWCSDNCVKMLAPTWGQIRLGPYIRGEADKRKYGSLFVSSGYVTGFHRLLYLVLAKRLSADKVKCIRAGFRPIAVEFRNDVRANTRFFCEIVGQNSEIRQELMRITRSQHVPNEVCRQPFIAVHVRRGDFAMAAGSTSLTSGGSNLRIPLDWFVDMLRALRRGLGHTMRAVVFTDGTASDVDKLLREADVTLESRKSAIHDILHMARSVVIISSGSGFSMWGSYLGEVPRICFPGQRKSRVLRGSDVDLEPECLSFGGLDPRFLSVVKACCTERGRDAAI